MEYTILVLLFYCSLQVFADALTGTQTLDCDASVQKQHRLLLQHDRAHLYTVRSAIKNINDSLQGFMQREQDLTEDAEKSKDLTNLLQDVLSKIKNNEADGVDENRIFAEKLENELTDLKSRLLQVDFKLSALKNEEQNNKLKLKQKQTQEKDLEILISQHEYFGPLQNIETYLVEQLERSHETLELERQYCRFKFEATSKIMEATSKYMEAKLELTELKNTQIRNTKAARPTTPPPGPATLSTGTYFFNSEMLNWTSAREHCQSLGMDLVAIETQAENVEISIHAARVFNRHFIWTSGCYSGREDAVVWRSTGHKLAYSNWYRFYNHGNMRNENRCVRLDSRDTIWVETPISTELPSICEKI
ncbi:hypothetical protein B566_EDAN010047 [Ephemera danica]|nr:hypothetical protein B566_EDAN010047 [Ephemera danica]